MKTAFRLVVPVLAMLALARVSGQSTALSIDALMATPFPTDLVSAPTGGRVAWVSSNSGVHNILTLDGPSRWRAVTSYKGDDGLWITDLNFTSDGRTIVYVRGDGANRQGENPNPAQLQDGTDQAVFAIGVDGGAPKRLGNGSGPVPSPRQPADGSPGCRATAACTTSWSPIRRR